MKKYIVKVFRHKPNRTYYLTHDCRVCTYSKKLAYRYDSFQEALDVIADFSAGKDEKLMIVEVKE